MVEVSDDPEDPAFRDLRENAARLEKARDASGNLMEVIRLLRPRWDVMEKRGDDFAASYVNCYLPNGGIVMPRFGDPERDSAARDLFARLMPRFDKRVSCTSGCKRMRELNYFNSTLAPASSSCFFTSSASAFATPSLMVDGELSTASFASQPNG